MVNDNDFFIKMAKYGMIIALLIFVFLFVFNYNYTIQMFKTNYKYLLFMLIIGGSMIIVGIVTGELRNPFKKGEV